MVEHNDALAASRQSAKYNAPMASFTIEQLLSIANQHVAAGRSGEARALCQQVIRMQPGSGRAWHLLGRCALLEKDERQAMDVWARALREEPSVREVRRDMAEVCSRRGELERAQEMYQGELALCAEDGLAWAGLGLVLRARGAMGEALAALQHAGELGIETSDVLTATGSVLEALGDAAGALTYFVRATLAEPALAEAFLGVGRQQLLAGERRAGMASLKRALKIDPELEAAYSLLGAELLELGDVAEAVKHFYLASAFGKDRDGWRYVGDLYGETVAPDQQMERLRKAAEAKGADARAIFAWALMLQERYQFDAAIGSYRRLLEIDPQNFAAINNLGMLLNNKGQIAEALALFQRGVKAHPDNDKMHSNVLFTQLFDVAENERSRGEEARAWGRAFAEPLKRAWVPHHNARMTGKRIRVGYVSPDFRVHPVGRFVVPLIEGHDRARFEVVCYSGARMADEITTRCRAAADRWVDTAGMTDAAMAEHIRADGIDILVDLSMHMAHHRLLVFAQKPAPVQVTYLAYNGTTGMDAIDYRISDMHLDPMGRDESVYAEQTVRLPGSYWCYEPMAEVPTVNGSPAERLGYVTFGSFNNFCKVNRATLELWRQIMVEVPGSRLVMHTCEGDHRPALLSFFQDAGLGAERIAFFDRIRAEFYFRMYHAVDVALDTFPYTGGTTTCDSLWMGVPVVSLVGEAGISRSGLSILNSVGLGDLAVNSRAAYVAAAVALARDITRLKSLRSDMRQQMRSSVLMNKTAFVTEMERAYRSMWDKYCDPSAAAP